MDSTGVIAVLTALRKSKKGQLKYDRYWEEEGRTKEILDGLASQTPVLCISPVALAAVRSPNNSDVETEPVETRSKSPSQPSPVKRREPFHSDNHSCHGHYVKLLGETERVIIEYETEMAKIAQQLYEAKQVEYETFSQELQQRTEKHYQASRDRLTSKSMQISSDLSQTEDINFSLENHEEKQEIQMTSSENTVQVVVDAAIEIKAALPEVENESEEIRKKEQGEALLQLHGYYRHLQLNILPEMQKKFNICKEANYLNIPSNEFALHMAQLVQSLENMIEKSKSETIAPKKLINARVILEDAQKLLQNISSCIDHAKQETLKELEHKSEIACEPCESKTKSEPHDDMDFGEDGGSHTEKTATVTDSPAEVANEDMEECVIQKEKKEKEAEDAAILSQFVDPKAFHDYCSTIEHMKELNTSLEPFRSDPKQKKYRLELHKAVAINTISDSSGAQLKERVQQLVSLLSGQVVESGGKYTSCKHHPLALSYCKNLLAEKLVTQGEEQVRSKTSAAFPFAVVAVTMCSKFPDLWKLILGHFYVRCPYLVPYYPLKENDQSDDDYYLSLGYKCVNDNIEEKTNFLKRMHGFVAMYAAIIQTNPVPGYPVSQSHGLGDGWSWMARILNIDPRPDITATVLLAFLEVVGYALQKTYDRQFKKILHILCKDYFMKIKQVTPSTSGGPVGRLKDFLQSALKKGQILQPEGTLSSNFWRT